MTRERILKYREIFNAWLDGANIQFYDGVKWMDVEEPAWHVNTPYRIKPTKIESEDCSFNQIEYKINRLGDVVEVFVDKLKVDVNKVKSTLFKDKEIAKAYATLPKLIRLMDEYNEGWKPDWKNRQGKYSIGYYKDRLDRLNTSNSQCFLAFKTPEIRDEFLEDHRELIEIVKPLL